jgi:hypothetical protein
MEIHEDTTALIYEKVGSEKGQVGWLREDIRPEQLFGKNQWPYSLPSLSCFSLISHAFFLAIKVAIGTLKLSESSLAQLGGKKSQAILREY